MKSRVKARRLRGFLCGASAMGLLAAAPALAQSIYVPNSGSNTLSIIDASGVTVGGSTVATGTVPFNDVVSSDQSRVYVSNFGAGTVSVIDTKTNTAVATITVGTAPEFGALSADNKTLYIANYSSGTVSVINTATNTVTSTITLAAGLRGVALSPDNSTLYVANDAAGTISAINTATNAVTGFAAGLSFPYGIVLSPNGSQLYVGQATGAVAVLNTATKAVVASINTGTASTLAQLAISPDGSKLYITNYGAGAGSTISVVNTATNTIAATLTVGTGPLGMTISPDGSKLFVSNYGTGAGNTVTVFNTATNAVIATLTVGAAPSLLGVCGNGNSLLASGQTFTANSSGALSCTLSPTSVGPVFTGGTLLFNNSGITGTLPITIMSQGAIFDTGGNNATLSGTISGSGGLTKNGLGTLTLTGAGTYSGPTQVNAGSLQAGADNVFSAASAYTIASGATLDVNGFSETVSSFQGAGNITLGSGTLSTGGDNSSTTFSGVISGSGNLTKTGSGTLTLSGANTYGGTTTLSGGSILVTGSAASSSFAVGNGTTLTVSGAVGNTSVAGLATINGTAGSTSVISGGTLTGTGKLGGLSVAAGGLLKPGTTAAPSNLTVAGNLTLASGATDAVQLSPSAVSRILVSGTASVNGTLSVTAAAGTYTFNSTYSVISASGGLSGSFSGLQITGLSRVFQPKLTYDGNNAYLMLTPIALLPQLGGRGSLNQQLVAGAIDNAVLNKGATPYAGFVTLYNLTGAQLGAALDQVSGQIGPNVSNAVAGNFIPFLDVMLSQTGGSDNSSMIVADKSGIGSAYDAPLPAQLQTGATRLWGSTYGGHTGYAADPITGGAALSATNFGFVAGGETLLPDDITAGASLAVGRQFFRSGNGTGSSNDYMVGLYGHTTWLDDGYVSASLGLGHHNIQTSRVITVSGTDVLAAKFLAHQFGGRVEAGYHLALDSEHELTPFAALMGADFQAPAYAESAASGAATFALAYGSHNSGIGHSELGARFGNSHVADGETFSEVATVAMVHAFDNAPFSQASFQGLPGASFLLRGVHAAPNTALLGLDLGMKDDGPLSYGLKIQAQIGPGTTIVEQMATLDWQL